MDPQPAGAGGAAPDGMHQPIPENETPASIAEVYNNVVAVFEGYGWFLLGGVILLYFIYTKLQPHIQRLQAAKADQDYYKKYDSGTILQRQEAMDAARQRLQQQHDEQAAAAAAKQKEREEQKRQEKLEDWDRHQKGLGYRSKIKKEVSGTETKTEDCLSTKDTPTAGPSGSKPKPKKPLRDNDYNPLTGTSGGSCGWRPARRGGAGGG